MRILTGLGRGRSHACRLHHAFCNFARHHNFGIEAHFSDLGSAAVRKYGDFVTPVFSPNLHEIHGVDFGPVIFRTSMFHEIGRFDEAMAKPGECGIMADYEISMRMWMAGYQARPMSANELSGIVSSSVNILAPDNRVRQKEARPQNPIGIDFLQPQGWGRTWQRGVKIGDTWYEPADLDEKQELDEK
ncbi:hypothetical protein CYMTET_33221 [Cymbomonas tetramitiformis]|uniref:Uncharacterized protein n=1 Tax=Cymbomonas tetramitiformis TaxID=36881 RepID=A0AAE0KRF3_9CHLO|nr:hypothetical protein CYMTET_33221 [Cymbomonas tetramitiformis]